MKKSSIKEVEPKPTKQRLRQIFFKSKKRAAAVILGLCAVIVAIVITAVVCHRSDVQSREYSGEATNDALRMCLDMNMIETYEVLDLQDDGTGPYSENLLLENCVNLHIWRDFTRPAMSCKKQILEKYTKLSGFKKQKVNDDSILSERVRFYTKSEDGDKLLHTTVLLRKDGWDYLVDFAVKEEISEEYEEYINNLIDGLFYL